MKHPERVEDYLEHIAEAIDRAISYLQQLKGTDALQESLQVQDAVVRNLEVIGEAANKIHKMDSDFVEAHPELPWIEMRGIRNKVIHNYFDIDWEVIWSTVKEDLPRLKSQIDELLIEQRAKREK